MARPDRQRRFINSEARISELEEPEATVALANLRGNPMGGYASAYETLPDYMRPRHNEPGYFENLRRFTEEVRSGNAELSGVQLDVLKQAGINYTPSLAVKASQGRNVPIPQDYSSRHYLSQGDFPYLAEIGDLAARPFPSQEDRGAVEGILKGYSQKIEGVFGAKPKRLNTRDIQERKLTPEQIKQIKKENSVYNKKLKDDKDKLSIEIRERIDKEGIHKQPSYPLPKDISSFRGAGSSEGRDINLNRRSKQIPLEPEYTGSSDPKVRREGQARAETERVNRDISMKRIEEHQKRRNPTPEQAKQNIEDIRTVRTQRETDIKRSYLKTTMLKEKFPTGTFPKTIPDQE
jgi:hypothetical protein